jgi:hypothetical protein
MVNKLKDWAPLQSVMKASFVEQYNRITFYYPLANEVAKGDSNATVRPSVLPSFHNILVNHKNVTSKNLTQWPWPLTYDLENQ